MSDIFQILNRINDPALQEGLLPLKIIFGGVGIFFLLFIIGMLFRTSWVKFAVIYNVVEFLTYRPLGLPRMARRWERIKRRLDTGNEAEFKLAIIEADAILRDTFERIGFHGETLGDQIKLIPPTVVPNVAELEEANRIRNDVVHDPDYRVTLEETRKVLAIYETALRSLDLI